MLVARQFTYTYWFFIQSFGAFGNSSPALWNLSGVGVLKPRAEGQAPPLCPKPLRNGTWEATFEHAWIIVKHPYTTTLRAADS
jgi:hypothetical protein